MRVLQLPPFRQQLWAAFHYPFHLSLVLFMQGFTQLILWGKAFNVFGTITNLLLTDNMNDPPGNTTSQQVANDIRNTTDELLALYPPKYQESWVAINGSLANISAIPNSLWQAFDTVAKTGNESAITDQVADQFGNFFEQLVIIATTLSNSVFNSFNIDVSTDASKKNPNDSNPIKASEYQLTISDKTEQRSRLLVSFFDFP